MCRMECENGCKIIVETIALMAEELNDIAHKAIEERDFYRSEFERLRKEFLEREIPENYKNDLPVNELVLFGLNV